jgi:hypothetical protein
VQGVNEFDKEVLLSVHFIVFISNGAGADVDLLLFKSVILFVYLRKFH